MQQMSHRFAAILAADVARYSQLMENDGEATVAALKNCRTVFQRCVTSHHGHEFGSVGDSLMAEFSSPVEALRTARDIQTDLARQKPIDNEGERLQVRIGLHAGDVISDGENLFGDVVNTAARLQAMAKPGGITVSELVHIQVRKEAGFAFRSLGTHALKNIAEPVSVFELANRRRVINRRRLRLAMRPYRTAIAAVLGVAVAGLLIIGYLETKESPGIGTVVEVPGSMNDLFPDPKSIAVLPFKTTGDLRDEYVSLIEGTYADIVTQLSNLGALNKVISGTSMEQYRDTTKSIPRISDELGVVGVLEGSAQSLSNHVRINLRLINGGTDSNIWAKTYVIDVEAGDVFASQDAIARDVAEAVNGVLEDAEAGRFGAKSTRNLKAHTEYTLGVSHFNRLTPESLSRARAHFEKAVDLDPEFALAYVGLADVLTVLPVYTQVQQAEVADQRRAAVFRALELAPLSGEAHATLAYLKLGAGQAEEAEQYAKRAIELSPDYAHAYRVSSRVDFRLGRLEEGLINSRKALELDPEAPIHKTDVAQWLWDMGRVEESQAALLAGVRKHPEFPLFYKNMAEQLSRLGRFGEALVWINAGLRLSPADARLQFQRCYTTMTLGDTDKTERCIDNAQNLDEIETLRLRISLNRLRMQDDKNSELIQPYVERDNLTRGEKHLFGSYFLLYGEKDRALEFWRELEPGYCGEGDVDIKPWKLLTAYWVARSLQLTGEQDRANYLYDQMLLTMQSMHRMRGIGYGAWDIAVYEARGETEKAIKAARQARAEGFRDLAWWNYLENKAPAAQELLQELMAEIEEQRAWYEEHKNDPLF